VLVAYWAGDDPEIDRVEDHVFACDVCAGKLSGIARLADGVARVASRRGGFEMVVTPPILDRLTHDGLRIRHYRVGPGGTVACTVAPDDDLVVSSLEADLEGVDRVDVVKTNEKGVVVGRYTDVPVDRASREILYAVSGDRLRKLPKTVVEVEIVGKGPGGPRRLGVYTFDHTPWPGAAG
jgi:hypothetical protein